MSTKLQRVIAPQLGHPTYRLFVYEGEGEVVTRPDGGFDPQWTVVCGERGRSLPRAMVGKETWYLNYRRPDGEIKRMFICPPPPGLDDEELTAWMLTCARFDQEQT